MYSISSSFGSNIGVPVHRKRLRIGAGIVDGRRVIQMPQIPPREALNDVQLFRVRMAGEVKPELVVKSHAVDHQGVAVPMPDGIAIPGRIRIGGVLVPFMKICR